jgi:hypothetical protein
MPEWAAKEAFRAKYNTEKPQMVKGADGYQYWATGPNAGQRVLPNVRLTPQTDVYNIQNAVLPDGRTTTLARENNRTGLAEILVGPNQWAPAPAGTRFFGTQATGTSEEVGVGLTTATKTVLQNRMIASEDVIDLTDRFFEVADPTNFGLVGSVRGTYQNARSQLGAIGTWADNVASDAKTAPVKSNEDWSPDKWFDSSLPAQDFLLNTLAYAIARQRDPSGRVSDMDVQNALQSLNVTGGLSNFNAVGARLREAQRSAISHYNRSAANLQKPAYQHKKKSGDEELESMMGLD